MSIYDEKSNRLYSNSRFQIFKLIDRKQLWIDLFVAFAFTMITCSSAGVPCKNLTDDCIERLEENRMMYNYNDNCLF